MNRSSLTRTILAVAISMLILFGWDFVSKRIWPPPKPAQTESKAPAAAEPLRQPKTEEAAKTPVPTPPSAAEKTPEPEPAKAPAVEGVTEVAKVEQPASPLIPKLVPAVVEKSGLVMLGSAATGSAYDVAAVVDPVDAAIRSITLTKFFKTAKDKGQPDREKLQLIQPLEGRRSLAISELAIWDKAHGTEPVEADIAGAVWEYAREESSAWEAVFKLVLRQGEKDFLEIKKTFYVAPRKRMPDTEDEKTEDGRYEVSMRLRFRDLSGQIEHLQYALAGPAGLPREGVRSDLRHVVMGKWEKKVIVPSIAPAAQIAKSQETFVKKWREENPGRNWEEPLPAVDVDTGDIVWAGSDDKYFAVVVVPMADKVDEFDDARISVVTADTYPDMTPWGEGPAGQPYLLMRKSAFADARTKGVIENSFLIFAGPKEESLLEKQYSRYNLPALIIWSRGCCGAIPGIHHISKFMVGVINAFTLFTFNHGLSIILVVVLLRLVLHPITRWSQKSMIKMQKLAPLIQELKASCGDDKRRLQQETMVLYKEHGVNPIGGCLPMVIQMPIWIGLYGGLMVAISLRQAPFLAWIQDLSQPDALVTFSQPMVIPGGDIPLLGFLIGAVNGMLGGGIRSLNILPLFMAVGMYLQQHMMPKTTAGPQAAQQKHMMIFMTVFFALILYNAPAGLNLYIFTSTMLGFIEQKYIRHRLEQMSNVPTVGGTAPSAQSKKVELGSGRFRSPAERLQAWLSKRVGAKRGAEQGRGDGKKREK